MAASDHLNPRQFFHGTAAPLKAGDTLVPGSQLGGTSSTYGAEHEHAQGVHVTDDMHAARHFAEESAMRYGGTPHVYQVEPHGAGTRNDISWLSKGSGYVHPSAQVVGNVRNEHWSTGADWKQEARERRQDDPDTYGPVQTPPWKKRG